MEQQQRWEEQLERLSRHLTILADKPEETFETTLKALWLMASGSPKSVELAAGLDLPQLNAAQGEKLSALVADRLNGTPLAYITGRQQFMGVELLAGAGALIPRKETEILGQAALNILNRLKDQQEKITLLDVCTGAGNLIVSLAAKVAAVRGFASDLSGDAVALAKRNVAFHQLEERVEVREGDLLAPFDSPEFHQQIDLLLCNPPYISSAKVENMDSEISQHEPALAFDGGVFGVKILSALMKEAPRFLKPDGWLLFEVGLGQGQAIIKRMKKSYPCISHVMDNNGAIRVIMGQI